MQFTFTTFSAIAALASTAFASPIAPRSEGYTLYIVNSCEETIWPAGGQDSTSPSSISYADSGFELASGATRAVTVPADWVAGRFFARTGCSGSGSSFHCQVGDCGALGCLSNTGVSGVSLAEFSSADMELVFYNLSLDSGYNIGLQVSASVESCPSFVCADESCPDTQAYQPGSSANPCYGCSTTANYVLEFCPA